MQHILTAAGRSVYFGRVTEVGPSGPGVRISPLGNVYHVWG